MSESDAERVPLNHETWRRFVRVMRTFAGSEVGGRAKTWAALLVALLLAISGLNVVNSYVGRDFMTAIESRNWSAFVFATALYVAVFAASTVVAVLQRFSEERLALLWRAWLTGRLVRIYLEGRTYYQLNVSGTIANPDQRIADDVRAFATTTLSLSLMLLGGVITIVAFSGVLWSISRLLFAVAVVYAASGSFLTVLLGRPLIRLSYAQADKEANFRSQLVHVRENAESIALLHRERRIAARLLGQIDALVANLKDIIALNRNLGFFTVAYGYLVQIIPALIVAPLFIRGEVPFGVITQSAMAFSNLLGAFSLVVTQFQSISSYAVVLARLSAIGEAAEGVAAEHREIEVVEGGDRIEYDRLTLRAPHDGPVLVSELSMVLAPGTRMLIRGSDDAAKALFRATAGMWEHGAGKIIRPSPDQLLFAPERPYVPPGTLREALVRTGTEQAVSVADITAALGAFGIEKIVAHAGGLDAERDWNDVLSLDEQQLVLTARVLLAAPRFAFLDRIGTALRGGQTEAVLRVFTAKKIGYVAVGSGDDALELYDEVLELGADGSWRKSSARVSR